MDGEKKGILQIISDIIESLSYIYNIIEIGSEEEESPLLEKKYTFRGIVSDIKESLLHTLLNLTTNELRILDCITKYRAITARNLTNFLHVSPRQIYRYLKRLRQLGYITYSERSLGTGPNTRFYHFTKLSKYDLDAAESLERAAVFGSELTKAYSENHIYECTVCLKKWSRHKSYNSPQECIYCKEKEVRLLTTQ